MRVKMQQSKFSKLFACSSDHTIWNSVVSAKGKKFAARFKNFFCSIIRFLKHYLRCICTHIVSYIAVINDLCFIAEFVAPWVGKAVCELTHISYSSWSKSCTWTICNTTIERYTHYSYVSTFSILCVRIKIKTWYSCIMQMFLNFIFHNK